MPPQLISHYRILDSLGSGGMGVVYRAEDTNLHRTVALKFISDRSAKKWNVGERLRNEARTASALNHPNICTIYEVGEDAGETFIAMEYVEGRTLAEIIRQKPLPIDAAVHFARQLASALAHAHDRGVLHGDLKPLNIVVTPQGDAKILDFGLARRTDPAEFDRKTLETASAESGAGLGGTLPYMAPEQIEGSDASTRTDIWSLGVVLYEMAAGFHPFQADNLYLLCNSILRDTPRPLPPGCPLGLATVVLRCLEKEPARRYQRASEARAALETLTPTSEAALPSPRQGRSHWLRMTFGILAIAAIAATGIMALRGGTLWKHAVSADMPSRVLLGVLPPISTGAGSQPAFDGGLADTLNARLGELSAHHPLAVIPMNSTLEKRITTVDAARQEFGVNLVLVLSIQRSADNVRVNYSLVDPRSHQQVRGGTVTAAAADPFALQDRVFESVATDLELQLAPQEKQAFTAHGTAEPAAYDFYVQGRGYLQDYVVPENVESAIILFGRALEKDPAYPAAVAGLGEAYWRKYQLTHDTNWADVAIANCQKAADLDAHLASAHSCLGRVFRSRGEYQKAADQYRRALEIDPTSDDAYGGLASTYEKLGRLPEAEQLYKQAIAERPSYWATYNWLGLFYMDHARYDEAASMFSQVVSLAPDSFTGYYNLGAVRVLQAKYDDAVPLLERSLSIRPTADAFTNLGTAYFQMRRYPESAAKFEEAVKLDDKNYAMWGNLGDAYYWTPGKRSEAAAAYDHAMKLGEENLRRNPHDAELLGYLAEYHAMRGERKEAHDNLDKSLRLQPESPNLLLNAGIVYQQLGQTNRALNFLERAVSAGVTPETLRGTPNFDALNNNPRFLALIHGTQKNTRR
jgi:serine/threonine protein kinase/tetratricopeptide (TPR) repeat protein